MRAEHCYIVSYHKGSLSHWVMGLVGIQNEGCVHISSVGASARGYSVGCAFCSLCILLGMALVPCSGKSCWG